MLAIVAQYQPVTRAEIEQIRGTSLSQATVDLLLEVGLIEPKGVKDAPGRPALWVTTPAFLAHFGLASLRDLPGLGVLAFEP
jgi:segregation and condensation protein B